MSINNGFIMMVHKPIYTTTTVLDNITPVNYAECGQNVVFAATVSYIDPITGLPAAIMDGSAALIDGYTGEVLSIQTIAAGDVVFDITDLTLYRVLYIKYMGESGTYAPSQTDYFEYYIRKAPTVVVCTSNNINIPYASDGYVTAEVTTTNIYVTITGDVTFRLYSDSDSFIELDTIAVDVSGFAEVTIPANTMLQGATYYITAIYNGNPCISPGFNGVSVDGFEINSI